jgi:hypothetical protein
MRCMISLLILFVILGMAASTSADTWSDSLAAYGYEVAKSEKPGVLTFVRVVEYRPGYFKLTFRTSNPALMADRNLEGSEAELDARILAK